MLASKRWRCWTMRERGMSSAPRNELCCLWKKVGPVQYNAGGSHAAIVCHCEQPSDQRASVGFGAESATGAIESQDSVTGHRDDTKVSGQVPPKF